MSNCDDFLALVHENEGRLRKICRVYADSPAAQRDLYQDILVELWRSLPSFNGEAEPSTWLYRVALNTALSRDRKQSVREEATLDDTNPLWDDAFASPGAELEEQQTLDRLYAALGLGLVVVGDAGLSWFTLIYGLGCVGFFGYVYHLNQRTVRQELQPRREKLTRQLRQLDASDSE